MPSAGVRPYVWMLCGCGWFSAMSLLAYSLRERCEWPAIAVARSGLAAVFAGVLAAVVGSRLVFLRPRVLWIRSGAGSLSMVGTFYALTHMNPTDVLTITNTFPVWVAVLSWPLVGERPTAGVWAAVLCSVAGVAVALQPGGDGFAWLPAAAALFASLFTAVAMLGLHRLKGVAPLAVVVHFSLVSTVVASAAWAVQAAVRDRPETTAALDAATVATLLAVGATATVGQVFLTRAFAAGSATKVSVVGLSQVVMVMAFEAAAGWKAVNALSVVGTLLVLGPVGWLLARERHPPPPAPDETDLEEVAIE